MALLDCALSRYIQKQVFTSQRWSWSWGFTINEWGKLVAAEVNVGQFVPLQKPVASCPVQLGLPIHPNSVQLQGPTAELSPAGKGTTD